MRSNNFLNNNQKIVDSKTSFNKYEFCLILKIYGLMVSLGEWRDYKISIFENYSSFCIYRQTLKDPI